jgi:hypothetical protein
MLLTDTIAGPRHPNCEFQIALPRVRDCGGQPRVVYVADRLLTLSRISALPGSRHSCVLKRTASCWRIRGRDIGFHKTDRAELHRDGNGARVFYHAHQNRSCPGGNVRIFCYSERHKGEFQLLYTWFPGQGTRGNLPQKSWRRVPTPAISNNGTTMPRGSEVMWTPA